MTKDNCVPACRGCNHIKGSWHPDHIPYSNKSQSQKLRQGIVHVREYLASFNQKVEA